MMGAPSGWDYFYHARVLALSDSQGKLLPYDPLSAGGRTHTYLPFYYSLILAAHDSTGLPIEALLRASSAAFLFLACVAAFVFLGRGWGAAVGAMVIAASPEVLMFSASAGLPSVASLFPLALLTAAAFTGRDASLPGPVLAILALALGALHPLSAAALSLVCAAILIARRNPRPLLLLGLLSLAVPAAWYFLLPTTAPSWGARGTLHSILSGALSPAHLAAFPLLALSASASLAFLLLLAASLWFPFLPLRFVIFLPFPLALASSRWDPRRAALPIALILALALFVSPTLRYVSPILQRQDAQAVSWLDENLQGRAVVAGHTDFSSVFLLGHARTIIDGYSEGIADSVQRQRDIGGAYSSGDFSLLGEKYGAAYVFTDLAEARLLGRNVTAGPPVLDNGYSKVLKLASSAPS